MPPHDDPPLDDILVRSREHARGFKVWLEHLRAQDHAFAKASVVYPDDTGEWQAAVYLLTASSDVWNAMVDDVLANTSIAPVIDELAQPHRAWSSSEDGVMQWAAHFWDVGVGPPGSPTSSPSSTSAGGSPRATYTSGSLRLDRRRRTMTQTLRGADIRGYCAALGVQIPDWARTEASVRCFADLDTHRRGDRDPSCSVNLEHGAWHCHACGAKGGAFDAARARGYSARGAIDLMVAYRLTEHRPFRYRNSKVRPTPRSISTRPVKSPRIPLGAIAGDIDRWRASLAADTDLIAKLSRGRGWLYATMLELELGVDRGRVTIPVRDDACRLVGLLRYHPWPQPREPKMLATAGSRRAGLPHPAAEPSTHVLLVEGEPDMIAARSHGLPAIAVPGVDAWRPGWARLLAGREVTVTMDCDQQGRAAAAAIQSDLSPHCAVRVFDLAPDRNDGYDLTDWLLNRRRPEVAMAISEAIATTAETWYGRR